MGAYAAQLERSRSNMTPEQIRRAKCSRCHARRLQRKKENMAKPRGYDNPFQQIAALDARLGKGQGAKRERARLSQAEAA